MGKRSPTKQEPKIKDRGPAEASHLRGGTIKGSDHQKRKRPRREGKAGGKASGDQQPSVQVGDSSPESSKKADLANLVVGGAIMATVFAWAYWPTLGWLESTWDREPDYSHGYLVPPLALLFLWIRRERFPGITFGLEWPGLVLIGLSVVVRLVGARIYLDAADGWSILLWVAGVVWLLGGWRVLYWSLPSIGFLWFMVPLPYRVERWLSLPLQRVATKISCWVLQSFGQPAVGEGNTIHLGDYPLEVEQACSGLRIFVGIFALAFAYVIVVRRAWWEKALLFVSVIPIALVANSTRIVGTGLLYQVSEEAARKFTHDIAGYVMIPFAAGLFALVLWFLGKLIREVHLVDVGAAVRRERG